MDNTLEQVRENVSFIGHAIEHIDSITQGINETRWRFEQIKRDPTLGMMQHPQSGQMVTITAEGMRKNYDKLTGERTVAIAVLLDMIGAVSVDDARTKYLALVSAYQRLGTLREVARMADAGYLEAREKSAAMGLVSPEEREAAINEAIAHIGIVSASVTVAPISNLVLGTPLLTA